MFSLSPIEWFLVIIWAIFLFRWRGILVMKKRGIIGTILFSIIVLLGSIFAVYLGTKILKFSWLEVFFIMVVSALILCSAKNIPNTKKEKITGEK